jgi:hypothetical protein
VGAAGRRPERRRRERPRARPRGRSRSPTPLSTLMVPQLERCNQLPRDPCVRRHAAQLRAGCACGGIFERRPPEIPVSVSARATGIGRTTKAVPRPGETDVTSEIRARQARNPDRRRCLTCRDIEARP